MSLEQDRKQLERSQDDSVLLASSEIPTSISSHYDGKIRNRLLCLILGVTAVILIALAFATYQSSFNLLEQVIAEKSHNEVEIAVQKMERWIEARRSIIKVIAHMEARNVASAHERTRYFNDVARRFGAKEIYLATESGQFISGNSWQPPANWDATTRPWYIMAKEARESIIAEPYIDDIPPHQHIITFAAPIIAAGEFKGVIAMDFTTDSIQLAMEDLRIGKYSRAYLLFDSPSAIDTKTIIGVRQGEHLRPELLESFLGSGEKTQTFIDEEYRIYARVADTGLIVVFHLPLSEVNTALSELKHIFIFGIIIALLVLGLAVSGISSLITRPILSLAEGANQVATGNYDYRLPISTRDELGLVTHRFNDMAEGLKERELIRSTFGRYVSPEAVQEILDGKMELGGEKKLVTVVFCDLRNFTSFTENCDPDKLVLLLNDYFSRMDKIIRGKGGSINRYLGDGILALFGAPKMLENSAMAGVEASIAMLEELENFNRDQQTDFKLGIGIHTGVAIVGNIGSKEHTEYTVIGNVANLASRIESLTQMYGEPVLISETSAALLPSGTFDRKLIDRVRVIGKKEAVVLYAPVTREPLKSEALEQSRKIVETYLQGNFAEAAAQINALKDEFNTPHLELLRQRCERFSEQEPDDWDGAYTLTRKS